jgi:hypothetical protein
MVPVGISAMTQPEFFSSGCCMESRWEVGGYGVLGGGRGWGGGGGGKNEIFLKLEFNTTKCTMKK